MDRNNVPIRVFGLSHAETAALRQLAQQKYGKASVSLLAKNTLKSLLSEEWSSDLDQGGKDMSSEPLPQGKMRLELKLPPPLAAYLTTAAEQGKMSANRRALYILAEYMESHPILTDSEITALYQSNVQLGAIGRNLNQIARHLNAGEGASLTARYISNLEAVINGHIKQVGNIIRQHRQRQEDRFMP
ncbi:plasmid mobilization relaxosome protein MobC [Neisseria zoodegmatis]|uniref:Bacterial mobilisation protein (MobC) n=1 Tax=Neisseria zoodegmatis TaxID=326523 RepID=A0AB38DSJ7_9NEIS|nr:plasmid mobilization relaxosome protein MobC [Neisseria zoodegmatis]OSI10945.1 hypothetical protein BWD10_03260 [Neisseria zoodegmatis]SNU80180.1 Bacterial mobilisation protein (MobC) [Neisseria zoodegmatis]